MLRICDAARYVGTSGARFRCSYFVSVLCVCVLRLGAYMLLLLLLLPLLLLVNLCLYPLVSVGMWRVGRRLTDV